MPQINVIGKMYSALPKDRVLPSDKKSSGFEAALTEAISTSNERKKAMNSKEALIKDGLAAVNTVIYQDEAKSSDKAEQAALKDGLAAVNTVIYQNEAKSSDKAEQAALKDGLAAVNTVIYQDEAKSSDKAEQTAPKEGSVSVIKTTAAFFYGFYTKIAVSAAGLNASGSGDKAVNLPNKLKDATEKFVSFLINGGENEKNDKTLSLKQYLKEANEASLNGASFINSFIDKILNSVEQGLKSSTASIARAAVPLTMQGCSNSAKQALYTPQGEYWGSMLNFGAPFNVQSLFYADAINSLSLGTGHKYDILQNNTLNTSPSGATPSIIKGSSNCLRANNGSFKANNGSFKANNGSFKASNGSFKASNGSFKVNNSCVLRRGQLEKIDADKLELIKNKNELSMALAGGKAAGKQAEKTEETEETEKKEAFNPSNEILAEFLALLKSGADVKGGQYESSKPLNAAVIAVKWA